MNSQASDIVDRGNPTNGNPTNGRMMGRDGVDITSATLWHRWDADRRARAALGHATEVGTSGLVRQIATDGASEVWEALRHSQRDHAWPRRARAYDEQRMLDRAAAAGLRLLVPGDAEWPGILDILDSAEVGGFGGAPFALWVRGHASLADISECAVAMVGARASTPYGEHVATDLAHDLARSGRPVVSGGAYGIDAASHRGALAAGGTTVAVLACGLDRAYPVAHTALFDQIVHDGLLVSEHPPTTTPTRRAFLVRNRLIAALTQATVIVEAAARSGARNTVSWAHACGRPVLAVPGPVDSTLSVTPHRLIRDQMAMLAAGVDDIEAVLAPLGQAPLLPSGGSARRLDDVPAHLMTVREVLPGRGGASVGEVAAATGLPVPTCLASLGELEELGLAGVNDAGGWRAVRP